MPACAGEVRAVDPRVHASSSRNGAAGFDVWHSSSRFAWPRGLVAKADARAAELKLDRGKYLCSLIEQDLEGSVGERGKRTPASPPPEPTQR